MQDQVQGRYIQLARTEVISNNLNPDWATNPIIEYYFEIQQPMKFEVFDYDSGGSHDRIGSIEANLGEIVCKGNPIYDLKVNKQQTGKLIIRVEEVKECNDEIFLKLKASKVDKKDTFGKSDPYLIFYRFSGQNQWLKVFTTEYIKNTLNPEWRPIQQSAQLLANGDYQKPLKIQCWDWDRNSSDQFIGVLQTTLGQLLTPNFSAPLINPKKAAKKKNKYQNSGVLIVQSAYSRKVWTFIDYLRGGTEFSLMVAIDFTGSNGHVQDPSSLHYLNPNSQNEYQRAIFSVGGILQNYDSNKLYPLFGFGGVPPNSRSVNHCFALTGDLSNPCVLGVPGIIQAYHYSLTNTQLSGPTLFQHVLQQAIQTASRTPPGLVYHVLLILTDGAIHDMVETTALVVEASRLPLSVIIVGLGEANFASMRALDSDQGFLKDRNGRQAVRDIVQFVPFREFGGNPYLLAKEVLAEVPKQLTDYMRTIGHEPRQ